jgi:hypothetical protein
MVALVVKIREPMQPFLTATAQVTTSVTVEINLDHTETHISSQNSREHHGA